MIEITGSATITGSAALTVGTGGGGGGFTYSHTITEYELGAFSPIYFSSQFSPPGPLMFFMNVTGDLSLITSNNPITITGITGPNSSLNGKTIQSFNYASGAIYITLPSTFDAEYVALGLPGINFSWGTTFPGITLNWN
jgi:hypothetical protein